MLAIGNVFQNIQCESFIESNKVRIRSIPCEEIPKRMLIECSKAIREDYPIGTKFYCEEVRVCQKSDTRIYLRAKDQMIYKL